MKLLSHPHIPVITVDLDEPATERWIKPGRKMARMVNQLIDSVMEPLQEMLPAPLQPLLTKKSTLLSFLGHLPARLLSSRLLDEAQGLSRATGVSAPLLALANCLYDVNQYFNGSEPTACSAAAYPSKTGHPVMIRYMDWGMPEDIGNYTIRTDYIRNGALAYSTFGFAGFLGAVTAVAPGWAFALNQAPALKISPFDIFSNGFPATYAARMACDEAETFAELQQGIMESKPLSPFLSLICGTEPGEIVRIEHPTRHIATRTKAKSDGVLGLSNHYIHRNHRKWNGPDEWADEDGNEWVFDTAERLIYAENLAKKFKRSPAFPTFSKMKMPPVFNDCTVHMAIMCPGQEKAKFSNHKN